MKGRDAMRRLYVLLLAAGLPVGATGCYVVNDTFIAGKCDCDMGSCCSYGCGYRNAPPVSPLMAASTAPAHAPATGRSMPPAQ